MKNRAKMGGWGVNCLSCNNTCLQPEVAGYGPYMIIRFRFSEPDRDRDRSQRYHGAETEDGLLRNSTMLPAISNDDKGYLDTRPHRLSAAVMSSIVIATYLCVSLGWLVRCRHTIELQIGQLIVVAWTVFPRQNLD